MAPGLWLHPAWQTRARRRGEVVLPAGLTPERVCPREGWVPIPALRWLQPKPGSFLEMAMRHLLPWRSLILLTQM